MKSLLASSILALIAHVASECPSGTMQGLNDQDCYHFNAAPAMWLKAEEGCIGRRGHLASISSAVTNALLRQIISLAGAKEFWLGGSWDTESPRQWSWTDGRRFSYQNWAAGQPTNQESYCTALDASSGRWYSRACDTAKPFICKVPPVDGTGVTTATATIVQSTSTSRRSTPRSGRCRDGWKYVAAAGGKCLRITDSKDTWSNTRAECRRLGGDLVSIPDNTTNYAIRDYAYRQEAIAEDSWSWFAIGIYKAIIGGSWQWTDGTPVTYTNWQAGWDDGPNVNVTVLGVFGQNQDEYSLRDGRWDVLEEYDAYPWQGICQSEPL